MIVTCREIIIRSRGAARRVMIGSTREETSERDYNVLLAETIADKISLAGIKYHLNAHRLGFPFLTNSFSLIFIS